LFAGAARAAEFESRSGECPQPVIGVGSKSPVAGAREEGMGEAAKERPPIRVIR